VVEADMPNKLEYDHGFGHNHIPSYWKQKASKATKAEETNFFLAKPQYDSMDAFEMQVHIHFYNCLF